MDNAVDEYNSAKSSLENVNSELAEHNQKIDELLACFINRWRVKKGVKYSVFLDGGNSIL